MVWRDRLLGLQEDDPNQLTGDPLLHRRDGCYAYHLAVVVDDGAQGVGEVVRATDLRAVTTTQIRVQEALGLPAPPTPTWGWSPPLGAPAWASGTAPWAWRS